MPTRIRGRSEASSGAMAARAPASTAGWEGHANDRRTADCPATLFRTRGAAA